MNIYQEEVKIKGEPLWKTTSQTISGGTKLLKAKDYDRSIKDRYEKENLNEGGNY